MGIVKHFSSDMGDNYGSGSELCHSCLKYYRYVVNGICEECIGKYSVGKKYDNDKLRYDLIPTNTLEEIAKVLTHGAKKYSDENWKQVENAQACYYAAAMRHIQAFRKGITVDDESGISHLAHAITCLIFMNELRKVD